MKKVAVRIILKSEDISFLPPHKRPVNMVFQSYALFPHLTIARNIAFGLEMLKQSKSEIKKTVDEMLRLVRMEDLASRYVSQISGGQAQRVALARALAPKPKVLLLDEPLAALDRKLRKNMQIELKRLQNETGITFVFVTHDQEEALTMSDRVAVMNHAKILQIGSPQDIYAEPVNRFVAGFIGESNFLDAELIGEPEGKPRLRLSSGETITAAPSSSAISPGPVKLCIRPEHARLAANPDGSPLKGRLENVVYFGTDTQYHVRLDNSALFVTRQQNRPGGHSVFRSGDQVGIAIGEESVGILKG